MSYIEDEVVSNRKIFSISRYRRNLFKTLLILAGFYRSDFAFSRGYLAKKIDKSKDAAFNKGSGAVFCDNSASKGKSSSNRGQDSFSEVINAKDIRFSGGMIGDGVSDDSLAFSSFIDYLNEHGGRGYIPTPSVAYRVGRNYTISKAGVEIDFNDSCFIVFNDGLLNTDDDHAVITVLADRVKLSGGVFKATPGVSLTAIRFGDYSYNGSGRGRMYEDIEVQRIKAIGMGKYGPGCGSIVFSGIKNSHAYSISCVDSKGQSFAIYGCINCSLLGGFDSNNGEAAFYIGPNRGTAVPSEGCWMRNISAVVDRPDTGVFCKISRSAIGCGVDGAQFYAKGNGSTFRAIDSKNKQQPAVLIQSGSNVTFRNVGVTLEDLDKQTTAPFGFFAHDKIKPLDGNLYSPTMDSCYLRSRGSTASINGVLIYPVSGLSVIKPVVRNCDWISEGINPISAAISLYANDPEHGKIIDLIVSENRFKNCKNGVLAELGPKGLSGDVGDIYLSKNNTVDGSTPKKYWRISTGQLVAN